jgi:hypothetical protein
MKFSFGSLISGIMSSLSAPGGMFCIGKPLNFDRASRAS